jgi:hypothetical protein
MTGRSAAIQPSAAVPLLADWGFLVHADLPDKDGPAYLLVALRRQPSLRHYDPEKVEYWVARGDRCVRETLTTDSRIPCQVDYAWGTIRLVDRLGVTNEYLTFGGRLSADAFDDGIVAVFTSPAPQLRRGGHSQGWDHGAEALGAFFGRLRAAVGGGSRFEARAANADPVTWYAAFLADFLPRYRASAVLREMHPELWRILQVEERRLQREQPDDWSEGVQLLAALDAS